MAGSEDKLRCPFCLEEIDYLENPKLLPCTHLYCTECLTGHSTPTDSGLSITCSICSKTHQLSDLDSLAAPVSESEGTDESDDEEDSENDTSEDSSEEKISCSNCEENPAECYCVNCDKKLCRRHEEVHREFFGEQSNHQLVSIKSYVRKPMLYIKPKCEDHGYDIGMCCEKCLCLKCPHCKIEAPCKEDEPLMFRTLADTESRIRLEFAALEKKCSEKQTEMCKKEKETWQEIDKLEEECEEMNKQVDEKAEQLILTIRGEADKFKGCIKATERWRKQQMESYLHAMREKRDQLEFMQRDCQRILRESYATELIKCREDEIDEFDEACNKEVTERSKEPVVELLKRGLKKFMEYQIDFVPDTLISIAEQETEFHCYSVKWSDERTLFSCGSQGLFTYDSDMEYVLKHNGQIISLWSDQTSHHMVDVFGSQVKDEKRILFQNRETPSPQLAGPEVLCKFPHADECPSFMTGYNHILVAIAAKSLVIYNKQTSEKTIEEFKYQPRALCFNVSGELLVIGDDIGLRKYKIDETGQVGRELWSCHGINNSYGICLTEKGLILVCSQSRLQIITQDGKLVKSINHNSLNGCSGGISIHGSTLAVPYWSKQKFMLYSLL